MMNRQWRRGLVVSVACAMGLGPYALAQHEVADQAAPATVREVECWGGHIALPVLRLGFTVRLTQNKAGDYSALLDIPMQNVDDLPVESVIYSDSQISFHVPSVGAIIKLNRTGDTATGTLNQMGQTFPADARRFATEAEALTSISPKRPQEPVPPFPYEVREVTVDNVKGGVTIAGTLTMPPSREVHPAVILISGSGPQDRDETIAGHKPFAVIADHLTRQGIAVLRFDDRGVGGTTGDTMASTVLDTQSDVEALLTWLKTQPGIDPKRIGLVGHSEGGCVAPLVATGPMKDDVSFLVLLAGMALPGDEVVIGQTRAMFDRSGFPDMELDRLSKWQRDLMDAIKTNAPDELLRDLVGGLIDIQAQTGMMTDAQRNAGIDSQMKMIDSPWYRHLMAFDPRPALRKVTCPMLAINGSLDLQVLPQENLGAIELAASEAGNANVTTVTLEGINHMMQRAETGLPAEYSVLTQTIDPVVLDTITPWIREQVGLAE